MPGGWGPDTSCAPAGRGEGGAIEGRVALLSVGESSGFPSVYSHTTPVGRGRWKSLLHKQPL